MDAACQSTFFLNFYGRELSIAFLQAKAEDSN
jgi:hypothetical protein